MFHPADLQSLGAVLMKWFEETKAHRKHDKVSILSQALAQAALNKLWEENASINALKT